MLDKQTVLECFMRHFPEWKKPFCKSKTFDNLLECFCNFINCRDHKLEDLRGALQVAKSNFDHLCENDPEGIKRKEIYHGKIEEERKEKNYHLLYEKHLKECNNLIQ